MAENGNRYDFKILYEDDNKYDREHAEKILHFLEEEQSFRGYAEFRDAISGQTIFKNFEDALNNSRYVLVLISKESIKDRWWDRQVETTLYHRLHSELKNTVVPIYLPNLDKDELPMSLTIFMGVYYKDDPNDRFWRKLARVFEQ